MKQRLLKKEQWEYTKNEIKPSFEELKGNLYVVDETEFDSTYSVFNLDSKFRELERLAIDETGHGIDIVVIDHIQLLKHKPGGGSTSSGDIINDYVSHFRQSAQNWLRTKRQVSIIILSQINRAGYESAMNNNGKYTTTAMAEANELERAAALILSIYSTSEMRDLGLTKIQVLKYRDGRNEDEPTEVNADFKYYLLGDNIDGTSVVTTEINDKTTDIIEKIEGDNSIFDQFMNDEFNI